MPPPCDVAAAGGAIGGAAAVRMGGVRCPGRSDLLWPGWSCQWFGRVPQAAGQQDPFAQDKEKDKAKPVSVFPPAPSDVRKPLLRAEKAIDQGRYADAAYELGELLARRLWMKPRPQDYFLPPEEDEAHQAESRLKAEFQRLLGSPAARQAARRTNCSLGPRPGPCWTQPWPRAISTSCPM